LYYSGVEKAERGIAVVVQKSIVTSVAKTVCNDRIIALELKAETSNYLLMQVYLPTSELGRLIGRSVW
jgi:hypothetical protein